MKYSCLPILLGQAVLCLSCLRGPRRILLLAYLLPILQGRHSIYCLCLSCLLGQSGLPRPGKAQHRRGGGETPQVTRKRGNWKGRDRPGQAPFTRRNPASQQGARDNSSQYALSIVTKDKPFHEGETNQSSNERDLIRDFHLEPSYLSKVLIYFI